MPENQLFLYSENFSTVQATLSSFAEKRTLTMRIDATRCLKVSTLMSTTFGITRQDTSPVPVRTRRPLIFR
jgi:hypothetical protein